MQKYKRWTTTSKIVEKKGILQGEKLALFSLSALLEQDGIYIVDTSVTLAC